MPVELLDCQPLHVIMDFAPLLKNVPNSTTNNEGKSGTPDAGWILGGAGPEGRRQRRIGVLLPRDALVAELKGLSVDACTLLIAVECVSFLLSPFGTISIFFFLHTKTYIKCKTKSEVWRAKTPTGFSAVRTRT